MAEPEGISVTFQGRPCLPLCDYARDVGLEPSFGFVCMLREDFKDFAIKEALPGVDTIEASTKTQEKPGPGARGFLSAGTLTIQQHVKGERPKETHKVEWQQVLVTERGAEVVYADDSDENEAVRVEITDIRYLYHSRGWVEGWVNMPLGGAPIETAGSQDKNSGLPLAPGSLDNGKPWTVERLLRERILPKLPGSPTLKVQSDRPSFFDFEVGPKPWKVLLAKEACRQVLEEFQLVFALNPDATVSIWARDQGDLQDATGQKLNYDPQNPSCDDRVATARKLVAYKHVPATALVVGAPVIQGVKMRLEACGQIGGENGKVVPLPKALAAIGLDMKRACKFAVLSHEERAAKLGITEEGLREFERWAFKWYRLPGGEEENADKLPILEARAAYGNTGEMLPLRVWSENHTVVKTLFLDKRRTAAGAAAQVPAKKEQLKEVQERLREPGLSDEEKRQLREREAELKKEIENLSQVALQSDKAFAELTKARESLSKIQAEFDKAVREKGLSSPEAQALLPKVTEAQKKVGELKEADAATALANAKKATEKAKASLAVAKKKKDQAKKHLDDVTKLASNDPTKAGALEEALAEYTQALHEFNVADATEQVAQATAPLEGPSGADADVLTKKAQEAQAALEALQADFEKTVKAKGPNSAEAKAKLEPLTEARRAAELAKSTAAKANRSPRAIADRIAEQLSKAQAQHMRLVVDVPFGEQNSGFEVDRDRGIVKFGAVQGRVIQSEAAPEEEKTLETCILSEFAAVELEFAFERKPKPTEVSGLEHSYFSVWGRTTTGGAQQAVENAIAAGGAASGLLQGALAGLQLAGAPGAGVKVKQLAAVPNGAAPLLIGPKPELQEIRAADGKTNKPFLDQLARRLAEGQLRLEQSTVGAIVELCRPVPLLNTGKVLSITWQVDSHEVFRCVAHLTVFRRDAPPSGQLRTRAYGGLVEPGSPAPGAVYVPRGIK